MKGSSPVNVNQGESGRLPSLLALISYPVVGLLVTGLVDYFDPIDTALEAGLCVVFWPVVVVAHVVAVGMWAVGVIALAVVEALGELFV